MTICKITGYACNCQPDEGALCNGADELRKACDAWRKKAEQFRGELSLAEEGLANYTQENAALRDFVSRFKELLDLDPENHPGTDLGRLMIEVEEFGLHPTCNETKSNRGE